MHGYFEKYPPCTFQTQTRGVDLRKFQVLGSGKIVARIFFFVPPSPSGGTPPKKKLYAGTRNFFSTPPPPLKRLPDFSARNNTGPKKHWSWSWHTFDRCTGGEHQARRCGEPLAQSARWRMWNGSNPSSVEKFGAWLSTRYPAARKTAGPLGVWRPCNLSRRGARTCGKCCLYMRRGGGGFARLPY